MLHACGQCIENRHENIALAQEHLQKSMSVDTVHRAIHKCRLKLNHAKKQPSVTMIQKHHHLLSSKDDLKLTEANFKNCSVVR